MTEESRGMTKTRLESHRRMMKSGFGKYPYGNNLYLVEGKLVDEMSWNRYCHHQNKLLDVMEGSQYYN